MNTLSRILTATLVCIVCAIAPGAAIAQTWIDKQDSTAGSEIRNDNPNVNFRSSEHFRLRWGKNNISGITVDEQFVQLNLQNAERNWHIMHDPIASGGLGFPSPSVKWSGSDGYNYRANWRIGQTFGADDGGAGGAVDGDGIATYGMGPWAMDPFAPTTVQYHEYGHGILIGMQGLNNTPYDGMWHEGWANFVSEETTNDLNPANMLYCHSFFLPHGRDYYDSWLFWEHIRETPGYGVGFLSTLFTQCKGNQSEYVFDAMTRLDTSGSADHQNAIKDLVGRYAARNITWDYERGDMMRNYTFLPNFTDPLSDQYRRCITEVVKETGSTTVYRVPFDQAPVQGGYSIIPIALTGKVNGTGGYSVSVDFKPLWDGVRQSDWRATLVAVNNNGEARYSSMWSCGVNTIVLSADEGKLYLVVAATPSFLGSTDRNFLYLPAVAPQAFEFSLVNTSATIYQTTAQYSSSGLTQVANGKGYRASTATVASTAYVGPNARVLGNAQVLGNARIEDYAVVKDSAIVKDNAVVSGHALVRESAQIYGNAKIRDWATVGWNAQVYENGKVLEHAIVTETAKVHGNATEKGIVYDGGVADVSGYAIKEGDCLNTANFDHGVLMCWVWGIDQAFADSQPDIAGLYCGYSFEKPSPIYAMDTYGIIHGYLMGGANRVKINDSNRSYAMQFDGTSEYIELRNDVNDFKDTTIACWVNWTGSANDQRVFSFGDGSGKYLYLTPKDATTGNLRLAISNGITTQYIDGTAPLTANRWTHIAVTFSGGTAAYTAYVASPYSASSTKWTATATLSVDGVAGTPVSGVMVPDQVNAANTLAGGNFNFLGKGPAGNFFQGFIDDFKVYSQAQASTVITTLAGQVSNRTAVVVAETDITPPTPTTATWLIAPTAVDISSITMSANKGTDTNGVLYNFVCTAGGGHSSGWISSNKYTDNGLTAGTAYTYTLQMKDTLGNTGMASSELNATTISADTAAPTPNQATFAKVPRGLSTTSITMTATKATDLSAPIEYQFKRKNSTGVTTLLTTSWQSSPNFTDTGLTSGTSYTYTVQSRDGKGNTGTASALSSAVISRDNTSPTVTSVARAVWQGRPYAMTDNTFWMRARTATDAAGVQYYFHCSAINGVAQPDPSTYDSGWKTSNEWRSTTAVADGTYTWQYKVKDSSAQANTSAYMGTIDVVVGPTTGYHAYTLSQITALPDDYLVSFSGTVLRVASNYYVVKDTSSGASITVKPNTNLEVTDQTLVFKNVSVKGHLYTYSGSRVVTTAVVTSTGSTTGYSVSGKVTNSSGTGIAGATVYVSDAANASSNPLITATTDASGNYSVSVPNGAWYVAAGAVNYYSSADQTLTVNGANVPNITFTLASMPLVSGRVTDVGGAGVSGATVTFATTSGGMANPAYTATTDASGNYARGVTNGTWYVVAYGSAYSVSAERTITATGSAITGIDFALKAYTTLSALVSLDPTTLATGNLTTWNNDGTLGGSFGNEGTTPVVEMVSNKKCVTFVGDKMKSTFTAPAGITGNSDWSVACWAYNPGIDNEECMVSWADRGANSRDMQFNYGNASGWGAATHMSNDLGWKNAIAPTAAAWHFLVLTFTGGNNGTEKVYVDGVLNNTATKTLNLFANEPMFLATAFNSDLSTGWGFSGSLAGVRVTDSVLTLSQIQDLYMHSGVATYTLSGTVTNTSGVALAGATVYLSKSTGAATHPDAMVTTDASGNYSIALTNGTWYVSAGKSGYATSSETINVINGADVSGVNFSLIFGTAYTITATAGTGGTISPYGASPIAPSGNQTFTITPNTSYRIDTVTVDGINQGPIGTYTFTNVTANHTISATFSQITYTITASVGANGSISPSGSVIVTQGNNQTFNIIPNASCRVTNVIVDSVSQGAVSSYTFTNVTANHTISATFASMNKLVDLDASTLTVGSTVTNWTNTGTLGGTFSNASSTASVVSAANGFGKQSVKFKGVSTDYLQSSFNTTGTGITGAAGMYSLAAWLYVPTTPTSAQGYFCFSRTGNGGGSAFRFDGLNAWSNIDHGQNSWVGWAGYQTTGTYPAAGTWHLIVNTYDGSVERIYVDGVDKTTNTTAHTITLNSGDPMTVGCYFWGSSTDRQAFMNGYISKIELWDGPLSASYVQQLWNPPYTITASAGANGSINPNGAVSVTYGTNQTFTFSPSAGYGIAEVKVDGASITPLSNYTFTNVIANHTISSNFAKLIGMNNKTVLTDSKVIGRVVKIWGMVKNVNETTSFTIDDGYGIPITVKVNGATLPTGFGAMKHAVVIGILSADKTIQAQAISIQ